MPDEFYEAFIAEMDKVTIMGDASAVAVVGACTRAAKRAQRVVDGEPVSAGPWLIDRESSAAPELDRLVGSRQPEPELTLPEFAVLVLQGATGDHTDEQNKECATFYDALRALATANQAFHGWVAMTVVHVQDYPAFVEGAWPGA